jgi:hypothetical protein
MFQEDRASWAGVDDGTGTLLGLWARLAGDQRAG